MQKVSPAAPGQSRLLFSSPASLRPLSCTSHRTEESKHQVKQRHVTCSQRKSKLSRASALAKVHLRLLIQWPRQTRPLPSPALKRMSVQTRRPLGWLVPGRRICARRERTFPPAPLWLGSHGSKRLSHEPQATPLAGLLRLSFLFTWIYMTEISFPRVLCYLYRRGLTTDGVTFMWISVKYTDINYSQWAGAATAYSLSLCHS